MRFVENSEVRAPGEWIKCRTTCKVTWSLFPILPKICWVIVNSSSLAFPWLLRAFTLPPVKLKYCPIEGFGKLSSPVCGELWGPLVEMGGRSVKHCYACWALTVYGPRAPQRMSSSVTWSVSAALSPIRLKVPKYRMPTQSLTPWQIHLL